VKSVRPDVLDEHFYMPAEESFAGAQHYDKYDRGGPKIFVGEWATREGTPTPNLGGAGRCGVDDGPGTEQRFDGDGELCAAVCECESGRDAVGDGFDWLRRKEHVLHLKLVNASNHPQALTMTLDGAKAGAAKMWSLHAASFAATNSITEPEKIMPKESSIAVSAAMKHTVPAYTIEVIDVPVK
jgi:alpha-N-arabinofuranosidase